MSADMSTGGITAASVIVATHGGAHRLPDLLRALAQQTCRRPWELVVVVDGIVDDTPALLDDWSSHLPLRTCVFEHNQGRVPALNAGYDQATGRVLIRCDDDLTPGPDFVERHTAWHDDRDDLGVIGLTRDVLPGTPYARTYGNVSGERARAAARGRESGRRWQHWAANNSLVRSTWDRVGGFDERFTRGQDFELGWRLHQAGITLVIDDHLEAAHRGPAVETGPRAARAFVSGAAHRHFDDVHPGARTAPPAAAGAKVRLWHAIVAVGARVEGSPAAAARVGHAVDRALPWVPRPVGRVLVAAAVEGAARAGYGHDLRALDQIDALRRDDLAAELRRSAAPAAGRPTVPATGSATEGST